jgi:hypothetical protein
MLIGTALDDDAAATLAAEELSRGAAASRATALGKFWGRLGTAPRSANDTAGTYNPQDIRMIEVNRLLFVAASLVLMITPGQDMIVVMSRSFAHGAQPRSGHPGTAESSCR